MARRRLTYGTGRASVTLDHDLQRAMESILRETHGSVVHALEESADQVYQDALASWPVKTGKSKAALEQSLRVSSDRVEAHISNPVEYVYYIRGKAQGGKSTWTKLVRTPMRKAGKRLVKELGPEIAKKCQRKGG